MKKLGINTAPCWWWSFHFDVLPNIIAYRNDQLIRVSI